MQNDRLRGGIKADEALRRAAQWWDRRGRSLISQEGLLAFNLAEVGRQVSLGKGAPMLINKGEHVPLVPSGILNGLPWARLTKAEQLVIVKQWHETWLAAELRPRLADPTKNESQHAIDRGFTDEQVARAKRFVADRVRRH